MKPLSSLTFAALLLAASAAAAQAQCCWYYGTYSALDLIERPHPQANLFPDGGWTLYPGQAGSGVPSLSHYSHVSGLVPPAVAAAQVVEKLNRMGVPIKPPAPQFLGRNPAIADNVRPPTPKSWLPKDEEKDKEKDKNGSDEPPPAPKPKEKEKEKDGDKETLNKPAVEKEGDIPKKLPPVKKPDR